jgi:hypothetical protein
MTYTKSQKLLEMREAIPQFSNHVQALFLALNNDLHSRYSCSFLNRAAPVEGRTQRTARSPFANRFTGGATTKSLTANTDRATGSDHRRPNRNTDKSLARKAV